MERNDKYDNLSKSKKLIIDFQMSMGFIIDSDTMDRVMKFAKQMCELQKQECANYVSEESTEFGTKKIKHFQVLNAKNICDE